MKVGTIPKHPLDALFASGKGEEEEIYFFFFFFPFPFL